MIVLDTNVVSEPFKPKPDPAVIEWLDAQEPQTLYITAVTIAELLAGVHKMPVGKKEVKSRRSELSFAIENQISHIFDRRILNFDQQAAQIFGSMNASAAAQGNPIAFADCAIAAMTLANGFALATRNTRDFKGTGVKIINPWGE